MRSLYSPCYAKPSTESLSVADSTSRGMPPLALPQAALAPAIPAVPPKCPAPEPSPRNLSVLVPAQDIASPAIPRSVRLWIPVQHPTRPETAIRPSSCHKTQTDSRNDSQPPSFPVELVSEMLQFFSLYAFRLLAQDCFRQSLLVLTSSY